MPQKISLRPFQAQALRALVDPVHLICVAATGSGKSLIYETMAESPDVRVLLVTPLVALARQQAKKLRERGIQTALSAGGLSEVPRGKSGAWILSPESLQMPTRQAVLKQWQPNLLVVDECHCLWDWGDSFRPAFAAIPSLLREHSIERSLWLTATLPPNAREDLRAQLPGAVLEQGGFSLPADLDLSLVRTPWPERPGALLDFVMRQGGSGLVFAGTRDWTERISRWLTAAGIRTGVYHAGMSKEERVAIEAQLERKEIRVVVCTSAFGMGMDFAHLEWVALWQSPLSLLGFAQAIGRVGRSGKRGHAVLLWDTEDFRLMNWMVAGSERKQQALAEVRKYLSGTGCRKAGLRAFFEPKLDEVAGAQPDCGSCDFCRSTAKFSRNGNIC